ncbi:EAL domain-containing protein [Frankia casuarinae]|uniref:putative bifunctional diguanylate cyclase/phosphodiesterase n=1 Tax=unclassified Frankia TaxID=2632575 RepID=UPI0002DE8053|nr:MULTISPECIES: bifunctional diguanylate cyclase/phosphodiesterase [Frankia]KEZ37482.1 diguanylate cyclase/phosphodiesterase [Frankia sp. CeD]ETA00670.1 EAL domain-containing protein [Frankia sp. CcI6]EYT91378.1 EAL domain-containing protein [Frankia casuarinae]KDA41784.1 EAL domain-containing protein [Frankia sp. BMG5.23]KFB05951.1 diguanylate cyclase/phosphodiesterase [Frankia sp. Allo2]
MISGRTFAGRRRFLVVTPAIAAVLFLLAGCIPGSPGYLRWGNWLGLVVAVGNAVVGLVANPRGRWIPPVAVASLAAALAFALASAAPGRNADTYLTWFPVLCAYAALVPVGWAVAGTAAVCAAVVAGVTAHGGLAEAAAPMFSTIAAVMLVGAVAKALFREGLLQNRSDPLTRLANRGGTMEIGQSAVAKINAAGNEAVLVLVDLNRFHEVNDALGHLGGDQLLRMIAETLPTLTPRPVFVGRAGGDEFALVFRGPEIIPAPPASSVSSASPPSSTSSASPVSLGPSGAPAVRGPLPAAIAAGRRRTLGRRVLRQIQGPFQVCGVDVEVDASVGIAVAPRDGATMATLMSCADAALLRAKRVGESVGLWDAGIAGVRPEEIALNAQLRAAIGRDELVLYYQPVQSARTGGIVGAEALLRWRHPSRGLLPPGEFLPIAERSPLIADLTRWVLDEALRQCAAWDAGGLHLPVSVNLSPRMLVIDDLPRVVSDSIAAHRLAPDVLTLEITESALVTQPARAATMLGQLRSHGVALSLDDFGTGYSSMEILKTLPFDEVKIDRGFVTDVRGSLPDAAIVRSVLDLGHRLGLRVVGEGIEDERTLTMMVDFGCDLLQGEAISPPLPAERVRELLRTRAAKAGKVVPGGDVRCRRA